MDQLNRNDALARAKALGPALAVASDEIEEKRRIPSAVVARIHELRLARLVLPRVYGGDEIDPSSYLMALEEISRHDGSVGWNLFVANSSCLITPFLDPETARTIYAEPDAWMSWGPPDAQKARAVDGGFIVDGTWPFASGCRQANWMGAHCMVENPDGSVRLNACGKPSITSFLFPVDEVTLIDTWDTLGLRGTASDSYRVENLFVSEAFTGTREEPGNRQVSGPLYWFTQQGIYAVGVAGVALGIAGAMLTGLRELALDKTPRGLERLADQPAIRSLVAQSEATLGSSRAYLLETLDILYAEAADTGAMCIADRARLRLATTHAIVNAVAVADRIHKAAGVSGIFRGYGPFEKRFRDIHTLSQQIQSRDNHFETVGGIMLGYEPQVFF